MGAPCRPAWSGRAARATRTFIRRAAADWRPGFIPAVFASDHGQHNGATAFNGIAHGVRYVHVGAGQHPGGRAGDQCAGDADDRVRGASPDATNPNISNPNISNPNISNAEVYNPNISNPNISNPNISNPNISNSGLANTSLADTQWPITNTGNTTTVYSLTFQAAGGTLPIGAVAQLIVARPYKTPVASASGNTAGCDLREEVHFSVVLNLPNVPVPTDLTDPQINNPDTPTITLGPGETALIIIRIYNPSLNAPIDASTIFTPVAIAQGANTGTQNPPTSTLRILNTTVANGTTGVAYSQQLQASDGTPPYQWSVQNLGTPTSTIVSFGLPAGLSLDPNTGLIKGTPAQSGTFYFGVGVQDSAAQPNFAFSSFSLTVGTGPLSILTASPLPSTFQFSTYSQYIVVQGGSGNFTFAITGGALPKGFTLDAATGLISGSTSVAGTYKFTVQVTDNVTSKSVKSSYQLTVIFGG